MLGIASTTMRLHVKDMSKAKRRRLANIIGALSEDEAEAEKSPATKIAKVTSPWVNVLAGDASGGKDEVETGAPKDMLVSANDQSIETTCSVESGGLAAGTSEELPHEETFDERGKFSVGQFTSKILFLIFVDPLQLLQILY